MGIFIAREHVGKAFLCQGESDHPESFLRGAGILGDRAGHGIPGGGETASGHLEIILGKDTE